MEIALERLKGWPRDRVDELLALNPDEREAILLMVALLDAIPVEKKSDV